ncbi:hypothetical protein [Aeromicrobium sp. Root472D3]|uniref:hypothetical protein n=1 Tax=Aeromicrobium sp. Root472D3 TaxID=1736540 RepID=UPI0006F1FB2E|nr:hypothetical protein [Aeromicrobium sp. Root472D3]KQX74489.1 hypothetical protein ASD10_04435 [Aeromicrobium sp. Root472D3]
MLTDLLSAASENSDVGGSSVLLPFLGALVGSSLTAFVALRRDTKARKHDSQRAALYELQDNALVYEGLLRAVQGGLTTREQGLALDTAKGRLEASLDRVDSSIMKGRCDTWRQQAEWFHLEADEGTVHGLDAAWTSLRSAIAHELRSRDA